MASGPVATAFDSDRAPPLSNPNHTEGSPTREQQPERAALPQAVQGECTAHCTHKKGRSACAWRHGAVNSGTGLALRTWAYMLEQTYRTNAAVCTVAGPSPHLQTEKNTDTHLGLWLRAAPSPTSSFSADFPNVLFGTERVFFTPEKLGTGLPRGPFFFLKRVYCPLAL